MIIEQLFIIAASVGLATVILDLIGANLYDVQAVKRQRELSRHPHTRQYRQRPQVSVVIEVCDAEAVIKQCLDSVLGSSYRKLEVIIIDNASRDSTRSLVRQFQAAHPRKAVRLVARRSRQITPAAVEAIIKKHTRGEFVLRLNHSDTVDRAAVSTAVRHFNMEPSFEALVLNRRILSAFNTVGLFQQYEELLRSRSKKMWSVAGSSPVSNTERIIYRRGVLPVGGTGYASDAVIYSAPEQSFSRLVRQQYHRQRASLQLIWQRRAPGPGGRQSKPYTRFLIRLRGLLDLAVTIVSVGVPFLVGYFIYMAIGLHEPAFLILSWIALGLLILFAIWEDELLHLPQKTFYSLLIPVTYGMFIVLAFVQVFTVLRTVLGPRKLLRG